MGVWTRYRAARSDATRARAIARTVASPRIRRLRAVVRSSTSRASRARRPSAREGEISRQRSKTMSRLLARFDDDADSDSSSEDVLIPVVVGGARRTRRAGARVRAPEESDSEEGGGGGTRDAAATASSSERSDETALDGNAFEGGVGAQTALAIGRARQDAFERARARRARARETAARRLASLEIELAVARAAEASERDGVMDKIQGIQERLRERDAALLAEVRAMRERRTRASAEARREADAQVMAVVVADAEARDAAERARLEEEKRKVAEAEAAKKKAEEEAEEAKKKAEEEAKKALEEEEARRKQAASDYARGEATSGEIPRVAAASEALEQESELAKTLAEARTMVAEYQSHPGAKMERRKLTNAIVVHVQQIAATKEQINKKSRDIMMLLVQLQEPQRTFALLSIAKKMLSQCDVQVGKLNKFSFALAEVAVRVAVDVPRFGALLVALIHEVCVSSVPKYYPYVPGRYASDDEYYTLMGYVKTDDGAAFETTDSYVERMTGIMLFYAAFLQVDAPKHPHGVDAAWRWLARLLNRCPPNRHTAVALDSFLKIAGYRMHTQYRGQFIKVLELVHREFLPKLDAKNDPDIRPVSSRVSSYLLERSYERVPEGRDMPDTDTSSTTF